MLSAIDHGLVERQALTNARLLERLDQLVFVEFLQADKCDVGDDGTLIDHHHGNLTIDVNAHVFEQARGKERAQGHRALVIGVEIANPKGQRSKHGSGVGALQSFHPNVFDHEGFDGIGRRRSQHGHAEGNSRTQTGRRGIEEHGWESLQAQQADHVIEQSHRHQNHQDHDAAFLKAFKPHIWDRTPTQTLEKMIHQVPPV